MRTLLAALVLAACPLGHVGAADKAHTASVPCGGGSVALSVATGETWSLTIADGRSGWVTVAEAGQLLSAVAEGGSNVQHLGAPYRFGQHRAQLHAGAALRVSQSVPTRVAGDAHATAVCDGSGAVPDRHEWFSEAASISTQLQRFLTADEGRALSERVEHLERNAGDARERALTAHLRAQVLLLAGRSAEAAEAFAVAERAWSDAGELAHARVAHVGRVEELLRLGRHSEVPDLVRSTDATDPNADYFTARLHLAGCLAERYLGNLSAALACFEKGSARMEALGETLDLVSALQDMADVSRFSGNRGRAYELGERALREATLPAMEVHRGRIALMLAELAEEEGDIGQALTRLDDALVEFSKAKAIRWEANALLSSASLYIELGALDEASDLVDGALRRLTRRDAPARVAAAQVARARIDLARGHREAAARSLHDAAAAYTELNMPAELDTVRLLQAEWLVAAGLHAQAQDVLTQRDTSQPLNTTGWLLLAAELAWNGGDCAAVSQRGDELQKGPLTLPGEVRLYALLARCRARNGDAAGAQALLSTTAASVAAVIGKVSNPLLRQMLMPHIEPLREAAFDIQLESGGLAAMPAEVAWGWMQMESLSMARGPRRGETHGAADFDAHVAAELLGTVSPRSEATGSAPSRSLLRLLGASSDALGAKSAAPGVSLSQFQNRLAPGTLFLGAVRMGAGTAVLWTTSDRAGLAHIEHHEVWVRAALDLTNRLSQRNASVREITEEAERLSRLLLAGIGAEQPQRLWVDASSQLASVPWSVMPWRGSAAPLIDGTQITLARVADPARKARNSAPDVAAFVGGAVASGHLPALSNTTNEPKLIATAVGQHGGHVTSQPANDRSVLLSAFGTPRPWLHLATHGAAGTTRLGYAGVWLDDPAAQAPPAFLSWLEILARGASSELVVLNACQLADRSSQWLSFADAVSRAGAANVVAARWQVSDGAASIWVPAFYAHVSQSDDVSGAMWAAQQELRRSRAYRHPFFWASFVYIAQV